MKKEQDYIQDIAEIRSMMERSSKFLSLSGWSGVLAGLYALVGAYVIYAVFDFNPDEIVYQSISVENVFGIIMTGIAVLILAVGTAILYSSKKAKNRNEKLWNNTSRRLVNHTAVPLIAGGLLVLALILKGHLGLIAPLTLIFYGIALYNAGKFTYNEIRLLGLTQIFLGLFSAYLIEYGLLFWAIGFGLMHIFYGIFIYSKYER